MRTCARLASASPPCRPISGRSFSPRCPRNCLPGRATSGSSGRGPTSSSRRGSGSSGSCARAAAPARRGPGPSGCGPISQPASIASSIWWAAPRPMCAAPWSRARAACSRFAHRSCGRATGRGCGAWNGPTEPVLICSRPRSPTACAVRSARRPGVTSLPAGATARPSTTSCWACAWVSGRAA